MWDLESGTCLYTLAIDDITIAENGPVDAGVTSVVFSPDGKFLAAGSLDTMVRIWDAESGQLLDKLKGHRDSVYSVAFSPDGKFLVSGSLDKTLKMFDIGSLKAALAAGVKDAPVGEGGKTTCLTTLQGHKVRRRRRRLSPPRRAQLPEPAPDSPSFLSSLRSAKQDYVLSVDISPDGAWIVSGSKDRGVQFWDPKTAKAQFMLQGHKNSGASTALLSFSRAGEAEPARCRVRHCLSEELGMLTSASSFPAPSTPPPPLAPSSAPTRSLRPRRRSHLRRRLAGTAWSDRHGLGRLERRASSLPFSCTPRLSASLPDALLPAAHLVVRADTVRERGGSEEAAQPGSV